MSSMLAAVFAHLCLGLCISLTQLLEKKNLEASQICQGSGWMRKTKKRVDKQASE